METVSRTVIMRRARFSRRGIPNARGLRRPTWDGECFDSYARCFACVRPQHKPSSRSRTLCADSAFVTYPHAAAHPNVRGPHALHRARSRTHAAYYLRLVAHLGEIEQHAGRGSLHLIREIPIVLTNGFNDRPQLVHELDRYFIRNESSHLVLQTPLILPILMTSSDFAP